MSISSVGFVKISQEADFTPEERRNIRKALREVKPRTREERLRESLVGRPYTPGQYLRSAAIGALGGVGAGSLGGLIQKDVKVFPSSVKLIAEKRRALLHPRRLAAGATVGAIYGSLIPAAQRIADIEAAKRGLY
jgi:hypothetical protein